MNVKVKKIFIGVTTPPLISRGGVLPQARRRGLNPTLTKTGTRHVGSSARE